MILFEAFLILLIVFIINYKDNIKSNSIITLLFLSIIIGFFIFKVNKLYFKNEIRENMIGSLTGGFENTLKDGLEKFIFEAAKHSSKEFVNGVNEKFKGMNDIEKKKIKKKLNTVIENVHFLANM